LNRGTIPIVARLLSLQTPAQIAIGGARIIAGPGNPSPLTALLRELNETILGRALRFETRDGCSLTLEAAGRRVLRLTEASGLQGAEGCLAAEVLEDENKDDLIKLMEALARPRQELRVTISARGVAGDGVSVGLPVALLADLLLIELNDPNGPGSASDAPPADAEPPAPAARQASPSSPGGSISLARFVQALAPTLMASVIRGGEADGATDGPEEMVTHLQGFLDDESDALHRQLDLVSGNPGSPACMVLGSSMFEGQGVLFARSEDASLLALFEGNPSQSLMRAWAGARA
jgi:hypothetical protein